MAATSPATTTIPPPSTVTPTVQSSTPTASPSNGTRAATSQAADVNPVSPAALEVAAASGDTAIRNAAAPTPEQIAHLLAIRALLTQREAAIADEVVVRMSDAVRAQWLAEISAMAVNDAADAVRSIIAKVSRPRRGQSKE